MPEIEICSPITTTIVRPKEMIMTLRATMRNVDRSDGCLPRLDMKMDTAAISTEITLAMASKVGASVPMSALFLIRKPKAAKPFNLSSGEFSDGIEPRNSTKQIIMQMKPKPASTSTGFRLESLDSEERINWKIATPMQVAAS